MNLITPRKILFPLIKEELIDYPTPLTLNYFWGFGSLSGVSLIIQIVTGVLLAMHYTPHTDYAFSSVERIMRDINYGWLLRYLHSNGASFFFLAVYLHIARGLYYFSFAEPKQYLWLTGVIIYILMIGTAFLGYVLPWGQMSFWAATVITNIITALPFGDGGESFAIWLWGGFSVDNPTLNRFFSLHYLFPFLIFALMLIHLFFLHQSGSSDPSIHAKQIDVIRFYPYFVIKDILGLLIFLLGLSYFVFFAPNYLGHPDNYVEANPLVTPKHIVPEWYFLPFYGMLRSIPNKFAGIAVMFSALIFLLILPFFVSVANSRIFGFSYGFLNHSYISLYRKMVLIFIANFVLLGWIGGQSVSTIVLFLGGLCTFIYFLFFFVVFILFFFDKKRFF